MWTIVSDVDPEYENLNPKRISYTYLHGKLEEDAGYDCYGLTNCDLPTKSNCDVLVDSTKLKTGLYPCTYNGKDCTLYFWIDRSDCPHGLVVYNDDVRSVEYAEKCMKNLVLSI